MQIQNRAVRKTQRRTPELLQNMNITKNYVSLAEEFFVGLVVDSEEDV